MKHPEVALLMAELYAEAQKARALLLGIGLKPSMIPPFKDAKTFWTDMVSQLELGLGIPDGVAQLLTAARSEYLYNTQLQELHAKITGLASQPRVRTPAAPGPDTPCPTMVLYGADLPTEFLATVRDHVGADAELLYVSNKQCAVGIPDPGDQAAQLRQQIQEIMTTYDAKSHVIYEKYPYRPYLISELIVFGPDTTPYRLTGVPSTTTVEEVAHAVVNESREAMSDGRGGTVNTVIDYETAEGPKRLDPKKSLHENKVREGGRLRIGTRAIAGISPELRMEAQLRMRAQIRRYAFSNPSFDIVDYDNEDLPNRVTIELNGPGFKPPKDLDEFLAGTENLTVHEYRALPWERLEPIVIGFHRFTLHFPPMFPVVAPFVVWETPVFHPNIWRVQQPGIRAGTVCLGPLMDGYRPDLDFGYLCQLLVDIATYRNYDVVEASTFPDPPAALWARTPAGQKAITAIGGTPMREPSGPETSARPVPSFWLRPLSEVIDGD